MSIFLYEKCLDSIDLSVLLSKLDNGIRSNKLSWFTSCLEELTQGSILGPLLFIIFINDLPKYVQSCNLYADDTMIEKSGKTL